MIILLLIVNFLKMFQPPNDKIIHKVIFQYKKSSFVSNNQEFDFDFIIEQNMSQITTKKYRFELGYFVNHGLYGITVTAIPNETMEPIKLMNIIFLLMVKNEYVLRLMSHLVLLNTDITHII